MRHNGCADRAYAEPFAGGAGAGIKLLYAGVVSKLALNDADRAIADMWLAILGQTKEFLRLLEKTPVTIEEWRRQREVWKNPEGHGLTERGFATFFLNRVNRSGILDGCPIGGIHQDGAYSIDARYNRQALKKRIERLISWRGHISFSCLDAMDFLTAVAKQPLPPFLYLDPPYVRQGRHLYMNAFSEADHMGLATWLENQLRLSWVLTYDDHPLIRKLYSWARVEEMQLRYSAQVKRKAVELLISPPWMALPSHAVKPLHYADRAA